MDPDRLRQRLRESLKVALYARDTIVVAALRSAISAIDNAEAVDRAHARAPIGGPIADARLGVQPRCVITFKATREVMAMSEFPILDLCMSLRTRSRADVAHG